MRGLHQVIHFGTHVQSPKIRRLEEERAAEEVRVVTIMRPCRTSPLPGTLHLGYIPYQAPLALPASRGRCCYHRYRHLNSTFFPVDAVNVTLFLHVFA